MEQEFEDLVAGLEQIRKVSREDVIKYWFDALSRNGTIDKNSFFSLLDVSLRFLSTDDQDTETMLGRKFAFIRMVLEKLQKNNPTEDKVTWSEFKKVAIDQPLLFDSFL